jgi:hypothetical protein
MPIHESSGEMKEGQSIADPCNPGKHIPRSRLGTIGTRKSLFEVHFGLSVFRNVFFLSKSVKKSVGSSKLCRNSPRKFSLQEKKIEI